MRHNIAAGNWKMNGTRASIRELLGGLLPTLDASSSAQVIVFPAYVHLELTAGLIDGSPVALGAKSLSVHPKGAHTGEVSGPMLVDAGCRYVLVGHSERRALYGEDDALVAEKFEAAQAVGLTPILCVGESLEEREAGTTEAVVARQLDAIIDRCSIGALERSVLAYEPVWAIGTGKTATPDQAQDVHAFLRKRVAAKDAKIGGLLRILYGGSVNGANAAELMSMEDVDGGLVGGASLDATAFSQICSAAG
ncbi:MAG: triose-phosphate isomerase [Gammaproteobacteria bacterium]